MTSRRRRTRLCPSTGIPVIAEARLFLVVESLTVGRVAGNNLADSCQLAGLKRPVGEA